MVHLVGIGGRDFSVGRLAGCRCPFTESTLTVLDLRLSKNAESWKTRNPAAANIHNEISSSPAIETTSRRRATKHVPRVSTYSPASLDPGSVEVGLVQLSQLVKTTNVTRTLTDRQTDRRIDRLLK